MGDLNNVQAGDFIAVHAGRWSNAQLRKAVVDRVTNTLVIAAGVRYRRKSGYPVGATAWDPAYAEVWDEAKHSAIVEEARKEQKRKRIANALFAYNWNIVSLQKGAEIAALLGLEVK